MRAVEIVGRGVSLNNYFHSGTETWACNMVHFLHERFRNHTKSFIMDDFSLFREKMQGFYGLLQQEEYRYVDYIYTSRVTKDWWWATQYPLASVIHQTRCDWFNNTLAYMVAFAIADGSVDELHLHGVDYKSNEEIRTNQEQCTTFWLGIAHGRGIRIKVNPASYLLEKNYKFLNEIEQPLYGYKYSIPRRELI